MEISLNDLLEGFRQSYDRTKDAKNTRDGRAVFLALFETLNWIVSIDDRLRIEQGNNWFRQVGPQGQVVRALRYARSRVHHNWADIIYMTEGATIPVEIPFGFHEWRWKTVQNLPAESNSWIARNRTIRHLYQQLLEDQPVRDSLRQIDELFSNY